MEANLVYDRLRFNSYKIYEYRKHRLLMGHRQTFIDGMRAIVEVLGVGMPISENVFGQVPIMLRICAIRQALSQK